MHTDTNKIPVQTLLFYALVLTILPETAHAGPFLDCVLRKLGDLVDYAVVLGIIALIRLIVKVGIEKYLEKVVEEGLETATQRLLKKVARALGKKIIPWIGAIFLLIWLLDFLWECLPILFE